MAKIKVEFDTKDKTLNVLIDGESVKNVSSVEFFKSFDDEDFHGSITTVEKIDNDDLIKVIRISAKHDIVKTVESSNLPKLLADKLFSVKRV